MSEDHDAPVARSGEICFRAAHDAGASTRAEAFGPRSPGFDG